KGNFGIRKCVAATDPNPKIPYAIPLRPGPGVFSQGFCEVFRQASRTFSYMFSGTFSGKFRAVLTNSHHPA
ncbi:MAG: hypothetical protein ACK4HD_12215, partial [Pannonibacter phragmitetus]